ncbi:MAG: primosome assembly protein PriA, partial [Acidothermus sp.]|nr:primosome assembly protein PriA [Acidothermus sp.]
RADRPVLVQVPRRGHLPALACGGCRVGARCPRCAGPLAVPTPGAGPACRWCGELATDWRCAACGHSRLRAVVVGAERTADELGRAFPGVPVRVVTGSAAARGETVRDPRRTVPSRPTLVVATPGAEPLADGGYGAGVLLDGWVTLARPSLRAAEEAVRRWLAAAALVRPDGTVLLVADGALPPVQAVVRWAPEWFARRELDERTRLLLPPASVFAEVCGPTDALRAFVDVWQLPAEVELFGPVDVGGDGGDAGAPPGEAMTQTQRLLLRAPRKDAAELADSLATAYRILSARKLASGLRLRIDPIDGL